MPWLDASTIDHPVETKPDGDTHRTPPEPCADASDSDDAPNEHANACASAEPLSVTTVPPSTGPDHGDTPRSTTDTTSNCVPHAVYSRPLLLTSSDTTPPDADDAADDAVVLHASADSLTYAAATSVPSMRQRSAPNASADDENPLPSTVSGVPPSDAPLKGHTDDTDANGRYVNAALLDANC